MVVEVELVVVDLVVAVVTVESSVTIGACVRSVVAVTVSDVVDLSVKVTVVLSVLLLIAVSWTRTVMT